MTTESDLYSWVNSEFAKMMGSKVDGALIHYFLTLSSEEDMREYLTDLFPILQPAVSQTFIDQLQSKKFHATHEPIPSLPFENVPSDTPPPHKPPNTLTLPLIPCLPKNSKTRNPVVAHELPPDAPKPYMKPSQNELVYMPERKHMNNINRDNTLHNGNESVEDALTKKRPGHRFVPFTSSEGARVSTKLPGRHTCQCIGQKHALVNNCTECGRVVCSQEGEGPCLFCGALVVSPQDQETLRKGGKKAAAILDSINKKFPAQSSNDPLGQKRDSSLSSAVAYKDRLLEYDRTCQQRTKVFDDESDYYRATKWMSPEQSARAEEIEELQHKLKHPSKRGAVTVTLDISGRQVFEDEKPQLSEQDAKAFIEGEETHQQSADGNVQLDTESLAHPNIPFAPRFLLQHGQRHNPPNPDLSADTLSNYRIQDAHLAELCDSGSCLSMHQPWASLLIHGIKRIEGRTWYTTHRGRLWIASTAKTPSEEDVTDVETFYQGILGDVEFPSSYPPGTLLGCVHLKDCLVREDYLSLPFKDETESPYGFICEDPHFLKIRVPIKGMHKIWKLDKSTHKVCKRSLSPSNPTF